MHFPPLPEQTISDQESRQEYKVKKKILYQDPIEGRLLYLVIMSLKSSAV